ncbi:MAG: hypothetical protein A2W20_01665 [Candidatus Aminicenantes bacterium RBG_16_66_30]|nr:MAG: hypothetical protein A2W20_01665 [Candidatus Aminicenantes bacterium RBG_16_66_30]
MDRRAWIPLAAALSCLFLTSIGWTQTTYKDPQGRFAIDLPPGWKYDPMMPMFQSLLEDLKEQALEITKTVK